MQCFLINLDRSADRLRQMEAEFAAIGMPFERVAATDATTISERHIFLQSPGKVRRDLTPGEVACFESHKVCWQRITAEGLPWAAVFEDDVHFSPAAAGMLGTEDWIPADADIVKLETLFQPTLFTLQGPPVSGQVRLARLHHRHLGSAGYAISGRYAAELLGMARHITSPVDNFLFGFEQERLATRTIYQAVPGVCVQDRFLDVSAPAAAGSLMEEARAELKDLKARTGLKRLMRSLSRPVEDFLRVAQHRPRGFHGRKPEGAIASVVPFDGVVPSPLAGSAL